MSSGGEVSVRFTSTEEAALWQSFSKLANAGKNVGTQLDGTNERAVKLSASLASFARQIQRIPTGGVETLATKLERVRDLLSKGAITPEQAASAETKFRADDAAAQSKSRDESLAPLKQFAARQVEMDVTPLERAQVAWSKLREAAANGLLTEQQLTRASIRVQREYQAAVEQVAAAQRKAAEAAGQGLTVEQYEAQTRAIREADADLTQFAERIKRIDETPARRLTAQLARLDQALQRGKLTHDEYGRAAKRAQDTYQDELRQSEDAQRRTNTAADNSSESIASFATSMGTRLLGLVGVARTAQAVFDEMRQAADKAAQSVQSSREGLGALAQFDPSQFAGLQQQARELRAQGAADSIDAAAKMLFAMRSAGAEQGDIAAFAKMSKFGVVSDAAGMARSASALQTALGKDQAGTFADIVGRALTASKYTPATAEQLVQGAAKAGSFARTQGVGAESLLAGTAILSSAKGSAEEGGSRLAALLRQTSLNKQFRGQDLPDLIDSIAAKKLSPERLKKLLGDSEAIDAFQILSQQREQLRAAIGDFSSNRGRDPIQERLRMAASDPSIAAAARLRETEGRLEVAREPVGVSRTALATRFAEEQIKVQNSRLDPISKGVLSYGLSATEYVGSAAPEAMNRKLSQGRWSPDSAFSLGLSMASRPRDTERVSAPQRRERVERDAARDEAAMREQRELARQMSAAAEAQRRAAQAIEQAVAPRPRVDRWGPSAQAQHARPAE